jgi:hypothetical protein
MQQWQEMIGKTIKSIDESCLNCVKIEFEDGEKVTVWAECGSGDFSIPFFVVEPK